MPDALSSIKHHIEDWRQIYIQVLLISIVTATITGLAFVYKNVRVDQAKIERNIEEISQIATLLAPILDVYDLVSVKAIGNSLAANGYIADIQILGKQNYTMYKSFPAPQLESGEYIDVRAPIEIARGTDPKEQLGTLYVRLFPINMLAVYIDSFKSATFVFAVSCVIGFLTALLYVQKSIASPLRQLQVAVEQTLTSGEPVESKTTDRGFVGKFQNQFNRMQCRLLQSQMELREKSYALETSSNLIEEVLRSVQQSVRLYTPPDFIDFGDMELAFPYPEKPITKLTNFCDYIQSIWENCAFEISTSPDLGTSSLSIQFDVNVTTPQHGWINVKAITLPAGRSALLITDITSAKNLEQSLQYAQKMEVVAVLTSGIAHDFNNVLAIISGNLELIKEIADNPTEVIKTADQSLNASRRAAAVVTSLLSFSKRKPERILSEPVSQVLEEVATIAGTSMGSHFKLETLCTTEAKVTLDISILESSLINLIVNARDAMPNGGTIRLSARIATRRECYKHDIFADRPYVIISVTDEGTGVPKELHDKITNTFFTTKSNGSGLGLSMIDSFVGNASGRLHFENNESKGMTFSLFLPCSLDSEDAIAPAIAKTATEISHGDGKTVMIIEDEEVLLQVMIRMFNISGFSCIGCASIADVRCHLQNKGEIPDIIVTDLNLPDGTGRDILGDGFKELAYVPKILLSGNMETSGKVVDAEGFEEVYLKPIETSTLISHIYDILEMKKNSDRVSG